MIGYGFRKSLEAPFERVKARLTEALKREGFGVLTEIPIQEKLKEKLGVDFPRYHILGACHPPSAYRALQAEQDIGLLLPCNVILYEKEGRTVLAVIRPTVAMKTVDNPGLGALAAEVEERLKRAFDAVV